MSHRSLRATRNSPDSGLTTMSNACRRLAAALLIAMDFHGGEGGPPTCTFIGFGPPPTPLPPLPPSPRPPPHTPPSPLLFPPPPSLGSTPPTPILRRPSPCLAPPPPTPPPAHRTR